MNIHWVLHVDQMWALLKKSEKCAETAFFQGLNIEIVRYTVRIKIKVIHIQWSIVLETIDLKICM